MIPAEQKQELWLNGTVYTPEILTPAFIKQTSSRGFEGEVLAFAAEWFNPSPTLTVQTSGSTGNPKPMEVRKQQMRNSARMTLAFLNLQEGDEALLAMPVRYIAGKMMVVRAIVGKLHLYTETPSACPLTHENKSFSFVALTPMQVFSILQNDIQKRRLQNVLHLLIGGGAIDSDLQKKLHSFPHAVWSSYGMTETLSHIALRRINGSNATEWYQPLPNIRVSTSTKGTLQIDAPMLHEGSLITNDCVEWNEIGQFRIIGRIDNVINSGGIKIQLEEVETQLRKDTDAAFQLTAVPDLKWGEKLVILTTSLSAQQAIDLQKSIDKLPSYKRPKRIFSIPELPLTETLKPNRAKAKAIALKLEQEIADQGVTDDIRS